MTDILIKKKTVSQIMKQITGSLDVSDRGIVIGDLRNEMGRDMLRAVESEVNKRSNVDEYWLVIHANMDKSYGPGHPMHRKVIKTTIMYAPFFPEKYKMMGTICFYVNNRSGQVDMKWCLPLDIPRLDAMVSGETAGRVMDSAEGMRIIH